MRRAVAIAVAFTALTVGGAESLPARVVAAAQAPPGDALAIIVHRSNAVDALSSRELRRIFMLEQQTWPHGRKITVVLREKGQAERAEAIRLICAMSEAEYDRHVLFQTFRGTIGLGPRSILSATAMLRFVFNAPGAVGYVPAELVDGSTKVLRIDGYLPGDARYPLRRSRLRSFAAPAHPGPQRAESGPSD